MDEKTVRAAESILSKGDRVELIPIKNGVRVVRVRREEVNLPNRKTKPGVDGGI